MSIAAPPSTIRSRAASVPAEIAVRDLEDRLRTTQQQTIRQRICTGALGLFSLCAVAIGLLAALDYRLELAFAWRALGLVAIAVGAAAAAVVGWQRLIRSYSLSQTAREAERRAAQFGQRLRTTLDYEYEVDSPRPAPASPDLLSAMHAETYQVSHQANWDSFVDHRPLIRALLVAAGCVLVWFTALVFVPEFRIATGRALLAPWQFTTVTFSPEASTVRFGESVTIQAVISGRPVESAKLEHRPAGSRQAWSQLDFVPAEAAGLAESGRLHGTLEITLADLQQDQEFRVLAGPTPLAPGSIRVLQPLNLQEAAAVVTPPAYTGRKVETVTGLEWKVLEGSTIELELRLNRLAAEGTLSAVRSGPDKFDTTAAADVPLTIDGVALRGKLTDLRKSGTYTITAKAADGMTLEPARLDIQVQLDRPPTIQFLAPPEELAVTPLAEVPMTVEAADDLGLFKVGIVYQVNGAPPVTLWEDDAAGSAEPLHASHLLMLEEHQLTFKDAITYYAFAEDNYFGQPRRTTTALRFIDIRPFRQQFQLSQGGGACSACSATLEELIARQRQQLTKAFAAAQHSSVGSEVLKGLAAGESDLHKQTLEFWMGMEERAGPIPELEEAVGHMESAIEALKAAQLDEGVTGEQQALAALIKARENVRKKLSQSSSASKCQSFDREQRQKLRMPEKKQQDQQEQLARARKKLSDLAQREREWSQQAQQACPNPSSSKSGKPSSKPASSASPSPSSPSDPQTPSPEASTSDAPSPAAVAKAQEKMLEELAAIQKQLPELSQSSEAARQQAQQAAASMQQGLDELEKQEGAAAAEAGERSAEELEQLAAHLAAMNARDVGQRLDQAQKLAQQLASRQEAVEKQLGDGKAAESGENPAELSSGDKQLAAEERGLATQAKMLAEQLAGLERDAATEPGGVGQKLAQLAAENPPSEIAATMEQAADDLQGERPAEARLGVSQSRQQLARLSRDLAMASGEYSQPQLQELTQLEEQLAQLMERSERAKESGRQPDPTDGEKWQKLAARLESMSPGDRRLEDAVQRLRASEHRQNGQPLPPGIYPEMQLIDAPSLREVAKALQSKIQEAILASALLDADQPVPPQYRGLVEKYYRTLSDDLR